MEELVLMTSTNTYVAVSLDIETQHVEQVSVNSVTMDVKTSSIQQGK